MITFPFLCVCVFLLIPSNRPLGRASKKNHKPSVLYSRYWLNKYITAMHDQTAVREKEGMSDGRGKRREKHTHPFFMASLLQLKLQGRKETEKGGGGEKEVGGGLFLCSVAYKLILTIFFNFLSLHVC